MDATNPQLTRRMLLTGLGLFAGGGIVGWALNRTVGLRSDHHELSSHNPRTAEEALARLIAGNKCYIAEHFEIGNAHRTGQRRQEVAPAQRPYAIILACADSRVSPEIIFSAGLGDLFVVRVAGNILSPACLGVLGSIEYAVEELKIPLVFVLGHEGCGAVKAAIQSLRESTKPVGSIGVLVDAIRPVVDLAETADGEILHRSVVANVKRGVEHLNGSPDVIAPSVEGRHLKVVGGVYELSTGLVRILS